MDIAAAQILASVGAFSPPPHNASAETKNTKKRAASELSPPPFSTPPSAPTTAPAEPTGEAKKRRRTSLSSTDSSPLSSSTESTPGSPVTNASAEFSVQGPQPTGDFMLAAAPQVVHVHPHMPMYNAHFVNMMHSHQVHAAMAARAGFHVPPAPHGVFPVFMPSMAPLDPAITHPPTAAQAAAAAMATAPHQAHFHPHPMHHMISQVVQAPPRGELRNAPRAGGKTRPPSVTISCADADASSRVAQAAKTAKTASISRPHPRVTAARPLLRVSKMALQPQLRPSEEMAASPTPKRRSTSEPYVCAICTKAFKRRDHLVIHKRVHTGEKPFVCPLNHCKRGYTSRSSLIRHIRSHHPDCDL